MINIECRPHNIQLSMFGLVFDVCRKTRGKSFRKTLAGDFKTHKILRKNPHAVDMETKYKLLTKKKGGDWDTLHKLIRQSNKPFGVFHRRHFKIDPHRIPVYDIPNIGGFDLLPYVSSHTPKVKAVEKRAATEGKQLPEQ